MYIILYIKQLITYVKKSYSLEENNFKYNSSQSNNLHLSIRYLIIVILIHLFFMQINLK